MAKLIHSTSLTTLKGNSAIYASDAYTDMAKLALIFTDDGYMVVKGKEFKFSVATDLKTAITLGNDNKLTVTDSSGASATSDFTVVTSVTAGDVLSTVNNATSGAITINHDAVSGKTANFDASTLSINTTNNTITARKITFTKFGHYSADSDNGNALYVNRVTDLVLTNSSTNKTIYLLGSTSSTALTGTNYYNPAKFARLYATVSTDNKTTLIADTLQGNLASSYISDLVKTEAGITDSATAAVAANAIKAYVDTKVSSALTTSMVFKGTIAGTSEGAATPANPTNGDTWKVSTAGNIILSGTAKTPVRAGDVIIYNSDSKAWELIPAGDEVETFITIKNKNNAIINGTNNGGKQSGEVILGDAATAKLLSAAIKDNTSSSSLVTAAEVVSYISSLGYSTTVGTLTSITPGEGLLNGDSTQAAITSTGSLKLAVATSSTLGGIKIGTTGTTTNRYYTVGLNSDNVALVNVPWTDTTHNFYVGASSAKANAAVATGTDVYLTTKLTSALASANGTNILGLHAGSGISISASNAGLITIANTRDANVTTSLGFANVAATSSPVAPSKAKMTFTEGTNATDYFFAGFGSTTVTYDSSTKTVNIAGVNTWRPVYAWKLNDLGKTSDTIDALLELGNTGIAKLGFSSTFAYKETKYSGSSNDVAELDIVWAEVTSDGITYSV